MTTLVGWVGVDSRGPASIYLASDSRISWGLANVWDFGRKLFASRKYPEILGYCGDVLFPTQVLGQIIDLIDNELFLNQSDTLDAKKNKIFKILKDSFGGYPANVAQEFTIVYCARENEGMNSSFHLATLNWNKSLWSEQWHPLPAESGVIKTLGSGSRFNTKWYDIWSNTTEKRTSRSIFGAFCDTIQSGDDKYTGGAPQLVGIYRKGAAESFGIIFKNRRFILGLPVEASDKCEVVEWRNCIFERCDWRTMERLEGAQKHKRPKGLGKALS
jgi:hypothetical protein